MAINSWLSPKVTDKISECIPFLQKALTALLKMEPASISNIPEGAKRMVLPNASQWKIEKYDGTNWVAAGKLMHDVDTVDGYHAAITPAKNTLAVRNADGVLQDSITGNAATATKAVALSEINPLSMGGTGSNTAAGARTNLGVPPIAHSSTANTYGLGSDTNYGHVKLSDAVDGIEAVDNGTAATPKAVKAVNDAAVHKTGDETIAGVKTFTSVPVVQGGAVSYRMVNTDITKGTAPTANEYGSVYLYDRNGIDETNAVATIYGRANKNGNYESAIRAYKPESGAKESAEVILVYPASGYPYATCPTPKDASGNVDTSDNSTKIATTQWVKASSLSLTGGTMTGNISFSNNGNVAEIYATPADASDYRYLGICANGSGRNGGSFQAFRTDSPSLSGCFLCRAEDESGFRDLIGWTNGNLQWNSHILTHVIETWVASDSTCWYRKWSDGWIEQGGSYVRESTDNTDSKTVTFNTAFSNTCYTLITDHVRTGITTTEYSINEDGYYRKERTYFSFYRTTNLSYDGGTSWYACGY